MATTPGISLETGNRWMAFVDGENLTLRGQNLAKKNQVDLVEGRYYRRDVFLWIPEVPPHELLRRLLNNRLSSLPLRCTYYTSVQGSGETKLSIRRALTDLDFQAEVFAKPKGRPSKGVDITLAKDLLVQGFGGNYDFAVLVAGDADFVPLVEEIQRQGRVAVVAFFKEDGLSPDLELQADHFLPLDRVFLAFWRAHTTPTLKAGGFRTKWGDVSYTVRGKRVNDDDTPVDPVMVDFIFRGQEFHMPAPPGLSKDIEEEVLVALFRKSVPADL